MKRTRLLFIIGLLFAISSCSPGSTEISTTISQPTDTPQPTSIPIQLEGKLFFDMNGTGLQDEATYLPCLNQRCKAVTEMEPGLEGFKICVQMVGEANYCGSSDTNGNFNISLPDSGAEAYHAIIIDPNKDVPEKAMRFINLNQGEVVKPAYTLKGQTGWMYNEEENVVEEGPLDPKIFYQGEVAAQTLYDTEVIKIEDGVNLAIGEENTIGLLNERITYPFRAEDFLELNINGGFDHDLDQGSVIDFAGNTQMGYITCNVNKNSDSPFLCAQDGHAGLDYGYKGSPKGIPVFAAQEGMVITGIDEMTGSTMVKQYSTDDSNFNPKNILLGYLHLDSVAVANYDHVYRGQIIGFVGNTGTSKNYPHLHFAALYGNQFNNENCMLGYCDEYDKDFYANLNPDFTIKGFNDMSVWTVWNQPVFYPITYEKSSP